MTQNGNGGFSPKAHGGCIVAEVEGSRIRAHAAQHTVVFNSCL